MEEDVALQGSHEEQRSGARVADPQPPGGGGAAEVVGDDGEAAARRAVALGVERQHQRVVLRHDDLRADHPLGEGDELLGDAAEHGARVGVAGSLGQGEDGGRRLDAGADAHGLGEERALGLDVSEERGGGDVQLAGDVGQGGGGAALGREDAACGGQDLIAAKARRTAHL